MAKGNSADSKSPAPSSVPNLRSVPLPQQHVEQQTPARRLAPVLMAVFAAAALVVGGLAYKHFKQQPTEVVKSPETVALVPVPVVVAQPATPQLAVPGTAVGPKRLVLSFEKDHHKAASEDIRIGLAQGGDGGFGQWPADTLKELLDKKRDLYYVTVEASSPGSGNEIIELHVGGVLAGTVNLAQPDTLEFGLPLGRKTSTGAELRLRQSGTAEGVSLKLRTQSGTMLEVRPLKAGEVEPIMLDVGE